MASCHRGLPLQHDLMKLSVRGPSSSPSTKQAEVTHEHAHTQPHTQSNSLMRTFCQKLISLFQPYEHESKKKKQERKKDRKTREQKAHMSKESIVKAEAETGGDEDCSELRAHREAAAVRRRRRRGGKKKKKQHTWQKAMRPPCCGLR